MSKQYPSIQRPFLLVFSLFTFVVCHAQVLPRFSFPPPPQAPAGHSKTITAVTWEGLNITYPTVVLRELQNTAGRPYDSIFAVNEMQRLSGLEIFTTVALESTPEIDRVALHWKFEEMPGLMFLPDAASEANGGVALGVMLVGTNFLGRNIKLSTEALWGKTRNYQFEFDDPWIGKTRHSARFLFGYHERENESEHFFEQSIDGELWVEKWFGRNVHLDGGAGLLFLHADDPLKTLSGNGQDRNGWLGVRSTYDRRDENSHPTSGIWAQSQLKHLFGNAHYNELVCDVRFWVPFQRNLYWAQSTLLQMRSDEIGNGIPVYETYRLGGQQTVRGYSLDNLGESQSGKNEIIATSELRWRFLPHVVVSELGFSYPFGVEAAVFCDLGQTWNKPNDPAPHLAVGRGVGIRLLVPAVKEVRLDYARGDGHSPTFSLTIGKKETLQRERIR